MAPPLRLVVLTLLACLTAPAAAVASLPVRKLTFQVPVTVPSEAGAPVLIDTDVYVPEGPVPAGGRPLVVVAHGGGSRKDNPFDAGHARQYAQEGAVSVIYSQRGHGSSGGETAVAGPKEMRDLFDVLAWMVGRGGRTEPAHPDFGADPDRLVIAGYSQGGLHVNVAQSHADDRAVNPYGFSFKVLEPGNTPDSVFDALVDHQVLKLTFGAALLALYEGSTGAHVAPPVYSWIATAGADQPSLYGGAPCDTAVHDTPGSTMRADLGWRSMGCFPKRFSDVPVLWMQGLDDTLFPPDMAISAARGFNRASRLYLDMAGHGAPSALPGIEAEKIDLQVAYAKAALEGRSIDLPPVTYWSRDLHVPVAPGVPAYPAGAWTRRTATAWPPPRVAVSHLELSADGRAVATGATEATVPLAAANLDTRDDPAALAVLSQAPMGTTIGTSTPPTSGPGAVASFRTDPLGAERLFTGSPAVKLPWTPGSADTQLTLRVFDEAPDGTLTILSRGVRGLRGQAPGVEQVVEVTGNAFAATIPSGHRLVTWISSGDASFYKPYPGSAGGTVRFGRAATVDLPLLDPVADAASAPSPGCVNRSSIRLTRRASFATRGRLTLRGRAIVRRCGVGSAARPAVGVSVARMAAPGRRGGRGRCRFASRTGRLGAARSCSRPVVLRPRGGAAWTLRFARRLPAGTYRVGVRAAASGAPVARRTLRFRLH